MTIRRLNPEEWQAYRALRLESLRSDPQAFGATLASNLERPDAWWRTRLEAAQEGVSSLLLFAEEDGQLFGMIGAFPAEEARTLNMISMFVLFRHRGLGIGTRLLDRLIEEVRASGEFDSLQLDVNSEQTAAVALYRSAGFVTTDEAEVDHHDGSRHIQLTMKRSLT